MSKNKSNKKEINTNNNNNNNNNNKNQTNNKVFNTKMNDKDKCGICLEFPTDKGKPNMCSHIYCYSCIVLWSKTANVCPVCLQEFSEIQKLDGAPNTKVEKVDHRMENYISENFVDSDDEESDDEGFFQFMNNLNTFMETEQLRNMFINSLGQMMGNDSVDVDKDEGHHHHHHHDDEDDDSDEGHILVCPSHGVVQHKNNINGLITDGNEVEDDEDDEDYLKEFDYDLEDYDEVIEEEEEDEFDYDDEGSYDEEFEQVLRSLKEKKFNFKPISNDEKDEEFSEKEEEDEDDEEYEDDDSQESHDSWVCPNGHYHPSYHHHHSSSDEEEDKDENEVMPRSAMQYVLGLAFQGMELKFKKDQNKM
ncbi:hypothetical protein DLAC_06617 [Tieghemostelium lacteum]|uniref:RING-type domain-containing protein n=1 Tax=Tieghemostelium lacteum TaxID=361077 RepID=A0A151ZF73_TIELA|nr:hypothetical protein DLAC_06617 [Tieghemostelium lacteum]|eukprot:KYQ92621.1 hypothetical protein DLAC_06617 [Tieghemostelium lacteum]